MKNPRNLVPNAGGERVQPQAAASSTGLNPLGCALTTGSSLRLMVPRRR
jgi:hypothetical protein